MTHLTSGIFSLLAICTLFITEYFLIIFLYKIIRKMHNLSTIKLNIKEINEKANLLIENPNKAKQLKIDNGTIYARVIEIMEMRSEILFFPLYWFCIVERTTFNVNTLKAFLKHNYKLMEQARIEYIDSEHRLQAFKGRKLTLREKRDKKEEEWVRNLLFDTYSDLKKVQNKIQRKLTKKIFKQEAMKKEALI